MFQKRSFSTIYGSTWRAAVKLSLMIGVALLFVPAQVVYLLRKPKDVFYIQKLFYKSLLTIMGFRLRIHGCPTSNTPTLFVANHTSYLDVPVLGSIISANFVAKAEVAGWPGVGFLSRMHNTAFIERRSAEIGAQRDNLGSRLAQRRSLILFPEGTSTDGLCVLPFKSSLFSIVNDLPTDVAVTVQPISMTCTQLDGLPIMRTWRPFYAWFGDMTFVNHFWNVLKLGRFTVEIIFHSPVAATAFANRKVLASYCQEQVARGVEFNLHGRGHLDQALIAAEKKLALPQAST